MEEKLKSLVDNIKERTSSAFIFSFVCSWLFINWEIVVALFSDPSEIRTAGYRNIFDFINCHLSSATYKWPLVFALLYTFLFPFFRSLTEVVSAAAVKFKDDLVISVAKRSVIKELRESFKKDRQFIDELNRVQMLEGNWIFTRSSSANAEGNTEKIEIYNGEIFDIVGGKRDKIYRIRNFYYNNGTKQMSFIKQLITDENPRTSSDTSNRQPFYIYELKWQVNELTGMENFKTYVTYRREREYVGGRDSVAVIDDVAKITTF
jgi:hypothetical protein